MTGALSRLNLREVQNTSLDLSISAVPQDLHASSVSGVLDVNPGLFAKLAYYLLPIRRKTVLENMRLVFGGSLSPDALKRLAQHYYGHLLALIYENLATSWMSEEKLRQQIRIIGHEIVFREAEKNKGILLLTGHFGNWELAPTATVLCFEKFKGRFHALRRQLSNKFFERILFRRFYKAGLNVIPKRNSLNEVMAALERNDVVAFIMDQYARPDRDGILVEFFGRKTGTFKSLALIAGRTGAPVIPSVSYRDSDGKHVMEFWEPMPWIEDADPDKELYENTRAYNRVLEKMVLDHPNQWMWAHRRWKVK